MLPREGFETPKGKSLWGQQLTAGKNLSERRVGLVNLSKGQLLTMQRRQVAFTAAKPTRYRKAQTGRRRKQIELDVCQVSQDGQTKLIIQTYACKRDI